MQNDKNERITDKANLVKMYNNEIYAKTKKYQKIYGFEIGQGEHDAWNNEADAFKHTFMQADLTIKASAGLSKVAGDWHEAEGDKKNNQGPREKNMDLWNNSEGRKIAQKIAKQINNPALLKVYAYSGKLDDVIANEVMQKMKKGDLITNPFKDKRSYQKKINGSPTGYAADIPEGKIFAAEEIGEMSSDEFSTNEPSINAQMSGLGIQREFEAKQAVQNGSMIWVNAYQREDGTEVKGYYRAR